MSKVALGLFSGGLDSILACRVVAAQGIRVRGIKFVTPFFDRELLQNPESYQEEMLSRFGVEVELIDISGGYLRLLEAPRYGFGKNFNPCVDCKIFMLRKAREIMAQFGADFILTGEVLGQRPMSQRRDTLRIIERDSGCEELLLRPLCAQLMKPTLAEINGWVDREQLLRISGRGRKEQVALAAKFGIKDYPSPAGGCMLTDPNLATRIKQYYHGLFSFSHEQTAVDDIWLLVFGRQFRLREDIWFVLGRDQRENEQLEQLRQPGDWLFRMTSRPGPLGLLRYAEHTIRNEADEEQLLPQLAGLVVRFGKKVQEGSPVAEVRIDTGGRSRTGRYLPLADEDFKDWQV